MKKYLFQIVNDIIDEMENVSIRDNHYTDNYFCSGFDCPSVFIGFDFFTDKDRQNYNKVIRSLNKKKNLKIDIIKYTYYVAGITVFYKNDFETVHIIEESKKAANGSYWEMDHSLRVSDIPYDERLKIMDDFHKKNVRLFLESFQKIVKIA